MQAQDIFNTAVTLMFGEEVDRPDYQPFWFDTLNYMLAENFNTNNALRKARGKVPLDEPPLVVSMTDDVEYEWEFTRQILPMGCAGYIFMEDDTGIATAYKNKYEAERANILHVGFDIVEGDE